MSLIFDTFIESYKIMLCIQANFSYDVCKELYPERYDCDHYFNKWESANHNVVHFMNSLDDFNKQLIFCWAYEKHYYSKNTI